MPTTLWRPPAATRPLDARVELPGSKSLTNRALILAALAAGPTRIRRPLRSRDTRLMAAALRAWGVGVTGEDELWVDPAGPTDLGEVRIDVGNAGTVARFVVAIAGLRTGTFHFDGDPRIRVRPVAPLLAALTGLGVDIQHEGRAAFPLTVQGRGRVPGGAVELDSAASSQFLSALLLAGAGYDHGVRVRLRGAPPSSHHVALTVAALRQFGAGVDVDRDEYAVAPGELRCPDVTVEPDLSSAAPFVAAALLAGGRVRLPGWPRRTGQPGDELRTLVPLLGGECGWDADGDGLVVSGSGQVRPADLDLRDNPELTPVLAALLCFADGPSRIRGVAHLRGQETDRLAALAKELSAAGAAVAETPDGLRIVPGAMRGGDFETYDDHRMVMAAAVLALRVPGVVVAEHATVGKTYPGFVADWQRLVDPAD